MERSPSPIIASSTSGYKPSDLQAPLSHPERLIVAHPFNPVYLLPLVEVVPSAATPAEVTRRASDLLTSIGMKPLAWICGRWADLGLILPIWLGQVVEMERFGMA